MIRLESVSTESPVHTLVHHAHGFGRLGVIFLRSAGDSTLIAHIP
jgi:hypothetical protein